MDAWLSRGSLTGCVDIDTLIAEHWLEAMRPKFKREQWPKPRHLARYIDDDVCTDASVLFCNPRLFIIFNYDGREGNHVWFRA